MPVTMREIAELCGVSTATVSMVLTGKDKGRVSVKRREEIIRIAEKLGYRSNLAAKGLVTGRTFRAALVIEGALSEHAILGHFSFYDRLGRLASNLRDRGYAIEIVQIDASRDIEENIRKLAGASVDGFIFVNWQADRVAGVLRALKEKGMPAVASGTMLNDGGDSTWTDVDRGAAFKDAVGRLCDAGHRRVVFLDCDVPRVSQYKPQKREAFLRAVKDRLGIDGADWVFIAQEPTYEEIMRMVEEAIRRLPDARAFLLSENFYAAAALHTLRIAGLKPGVDCRVIGLGDSPLADRCRPALSHYTLEIPAQAQFSVDMLLDEIDNPSEHQPRHRIFAPPYVQRET